MVEISDEQGWEKALWNVEKNLVDKKLDDIKNFVCGGATLESTREKIEDFNSTINFIYPENEDLYDKLRFRMFVKDLDIVLFQSPKVVSEIDKLFEVSNKTYDLYGYDEVDVDVRRYGTPEV